MQGVSISSAYLHDGRPGTAHQYLDAAQDLQECRPSCFWECAVHIAHPAAEDLHLEVVLEDACTCEQLGHVACTTAARLGADLHVFDTRFDTRTRNFDGLSFMVLITEVKADAISWTKDMVGQGVFSHKNLQRLQKRLGCVNVSFVWLIAEFLDTTNADASH